ncbi:biotin-dependent carboxyltransferase family protein [Hyphomonas johnsonii]|uniref:Allophanate hydrolase subunit 2 n=1 Tax=Hyphomonas johnsonii MHS-2 TaxID=1280950 RepID=A0A059FW62_9PROT|nr:biotin-dependent carboxyltransferase family protein [Hyphomonas johnsonii]KCZ94683.1 allophanate hydrolase subunit 2 [Hyphomonas johnsonii MHS-2]
MSLTILQPGAQMTLQGAPRIGTRHLGVPASGPADPLSMALANHLVGNACDATCIEITFGNAAIRFNTAASFALTGAPAAAALAGRAIAPHTAHTAQAGNELRIDGVGQGCRIYLSIAGTLATNAFLGSTSTYLPARLGGHEGRALKPGDQIAIAAPRSAPTIETPAEFRPICSNSYALRAVEGPDYVASQSGIWDETFTATQRASRMGLELEGRFPDPASASDIPSSAVFPGALQLPPGGHGFLLLADGQTTGGYPHILQVVRADRHILGQIRPGDRIRFLQRTHAQATEALRAKQALLAGWLPEFSL